MLEKIIDLILENIVFIIAVAGGILALFKNKDEEEEKPEPRRERAPARNNRSHTEKEKSPQQKLETNRAKQQKAMDAAAAAVREAAEMAERSAKIEPQRVTTDHVKTANKSGVALNLKKQDITKKKLAESILMAEILGPPRAVKPHRQEIRMRRK